MIHLATIGQRPACGAGERWQSAFITTNRDPTSVDCKSCRKTMAFFQRSNP